MKPVDLDIDDYHAVLQEFHQESDRAAAVLGGSFVECYLAKYMRSAMVVDAKNELFDNNGPFSTYSQRIQGAHAFGMISTATKGDLELIGKIRNRFSHHPLKSTFDTAPITDWCNMLSTANLIPLPGTEKNIGTDNRNRFVIAISMVVANWHNALLKSQEKL